MLSILGTDTDRVRSVLGISEKDMSDERLTVRDLEKELNFDLTSWVTNLQTLLDNVNSGTATAIESSIVDAIGLYSTYFCARLVVPSLQMGALHSVSDGKNTMDRFATVNWDQLYDRMSERTAFYKKFISDNNVSVSITQVFKPFSLASAAYDPVRGA